MTEHRKPGPTGLNEMWQEGDHYHSVFGHCIDLTQEQADSLNAQITEFKEKAASAELLRQSFDYTRHCPKCRCTFPADVAYCHENSECAIAHGSSEHFDRICRGCGYVWPENLP